MKAWTMTVPALALAFCVSVPAQAQGQDLPRHRPEFGGPFGPGLPPRLGDALGLTEEQRAQVRSLFETNRESLRPLVEEARQAHEDFRLSLGAEPPDPMTVGQAALAMHAAEKNVRAAHDVVFEQVRSILTAEQRAKLESASEQGLRRAPGRPAWGQVFR